MRSGVFPPGRRLDRAPEQDGFGDRVIARGELIGAPTTAAAHFSDRLRENIAAEAVVHAGRALRCTASFGVGEIASSDRSFDNVLARSDQALYWAKQAGRNRVMVEDGSPEPVNPRRREISA